VRLFLLGLLPLASGVFMVGSGGVALLTQDLDRTNRINAWGLLVIGLGVAWWGVTRARRALALLSRPVILLLDDEGVHAWTGPVGSPSPVWLSWADLEAVAVLPAPSAYRTKTGDETVLRFVARSDDRVHRFYGDPFTRRKAQLLDLSTPQASLALIQARTSAFRVPLVLDWVARHQPSVPVVDNRHPA
jgi:hypothetical protein